MTYAFKKLNATADPAREPLTRIAGRLTDGTVRKHLLQCGVELPPDSELNVILASGKTLADSDIRKIDAALDKSGLSISERLRFKYALTQKGLLPKGRPYQMPSADRLAPMSKNRVLTFTNY